MSDFDLHYAFVEAADLVVSDNDVWGFVCGYCNRICAERQVCESCHTQFCDQCGVIEHASVRSITHENMQLATPPLFVSMASCSLQCRDSILLSVPGRQWLFKDNQVPDIPKFPTYYRKGG